MRSADVKNGLIQRFEGRGAATKVEAFFDGFAALSSETSRQIGLYTILLVALTAVFAVVARMGLIYAVAAAILGALFLYRAFVLWRQGAAPEPSTQQAIRLYRYSITYLTALFGAVALDTVFRF